MVKKEYVVIMRVEETDPAELADKIAEATGGECIQIDEMNPPDYTTTEVVWQA